MMLLIISISFIVNYIPQSFAEDYWRSPILKWGHSPTICALSPTDPMFPNLSDKMLTETRNAILDWELKLNNNNLGNNPWSISLSEIPLSKSDTFDKTKCDITVNFKDKPDNVDPSFYETGVTDIHNFPKVSVTIYYLGADVNVKQVQYGGLWYYVHELDYTSHFATDPQIKSTIRHEIGHALGLGHYVVGEDELKRITELGTEYSPSIMVENGLVGVGITHFDITSIDVSEVKTIYGSGGFPVLQHNSIPNPASSVSTISKPTASTNESYPNPPIPTIPRTPTVSATTPKIPTWIKNNAKWWSEGMVSDDEFVSAIQYMVQQGILKIQKVPSSSASPTIPGWVRSNAGLWADGSISDYEFLRGIQYLASVGIIQI